jgi:limonene-1,2-epoxide hydrolase
VLSNGAKNSARVTPSWIETIGVVGHIRHNGLDVDPRPQVCFNYLQRAFQGIQGRPKRLTTIDSQRPTSARAVRIMREAATLARVYCDRAGAPYRRALVLASRPSGSHP